MKEVLIINAGGFGKSVLSTALKDPAYQKDWVIKGFLDTRIYDDQNLPYPILGSPFSYIHDTSQIILCALGSPVDRMKYSQFLWERGADFMNLMPNLHLAQSVKMGHGCIFEHDVSLGYNAQLGNFVLILAMSIVGYEVQIGSYTTIESFVAIGGGAKIGESVTIHPHCTILPGVEIGNNAIIGAGSVVLSDVPAGMTYHGNPAKPLRF
jgi:sugar O-acyltransferase (sialic acid O-acetyltransferase NeuD family)